MSHRCLIHSSRPVRSGGASLVLFSVLLLIAGGVSLSVWKLGGKKVQQGPAVITHTIQRGLFENEVVERGEIESSSNVEVRCEVRARGNGGVTILKVIEEGAQVQAGDILVELDSSGMAKEVVEQQIKCNSSQAAMIEAKNRYEAAKIAEEEYVKGTYKQEEEQIQSEIFISEENLRRAKEYLSYSQRLAARGYVTSQQLEGDQFAVEKAKTELSVAKTKLKVLQEYTKRKTLKSLQSDIKSAEADWKSKESSYELELAELADEQEQVEKCTIRAPSAGQVVYANRQSSRRESEFLVEQGAAVRENQELIRLPDPTKMQVKAKVNESQVTSITAGMPASIRLDAFGDSLLEGEVIKVNEYPEAAGWYSSQVKEYATYIKILNPPPGLRPGLTAEVTIHVQRTENAIMLPVQTVYEHGRDLYSFKQAGENEWQACKLTVGSTNEKFVYVKDGIEENDVVAMNPRSLLDRVELPEIVEEETEVSRRAASEAPEKRKMSSGRPGAASGGGGANVGAIVTAIFSKLDKNGDGKLAGDEFPADQAESLKKSDANKDGVVDKAEMTKSIKSRMSAGGGRPGGGRPGGGS